MKQHQGKIIGLGVSVAVVTFLILLGLVFIGGGQGTDPGLMPDMTVVDGASERL